MGRDSPGIHKGPDGRPFAGAAFDSWMGMMGPPLSVVGRRSDREEPDGS
jgi:hypothetical protein